MANQTSLIMRNCIRRFLIAPSRKRSGMENNMDIKTILKNMVSNYFVIFTGTMLGTLVFCLVFEPNDQFSLAYLGWMFFFSLIGDLPLLVFWTNKNLSNRQWAVRMICHALLLETVLLILGYKLEMYDTFVEGCFFALIVAGVYVLVRFLGFRSDIKLARELNERVKEIKNL